MEKCLFSAPTSFMLEIKKEYNDIVPTIFQEIWHETQLKKDSNLTIWVPNPGQNFIIGDKILNLFPNLHTIITPSTGRNHIDIKACNMRNIRVFSLLDDRQGMETISASAEFTFLMILNTLRRLDVAIDEVTSGNWRKNEDYMRGHELSGKKVGLIGLGRIGTKVAKYCTAFEASVSYYDPYKSVTQYIKDSLENIFKNNDIIVICCELNQETTGLVNKPLLESMKKNVCLINTARGEIINELDLSEIIRERSDIRVGLDVIAGEVTNTHYLSPLINLHRSKRITITPHIAGATYESQHKAAKIVLKLLTRRVKDWDSSKDYSI